jgi:hypothetical protein
VLHAITAGLRADPRVAAAWLSGSFGRDEADEWSDLDLHVAVGDGAALETWLGDPRPLFALGGEPLLVQANFPSDSMLGGRFWLVVYEGPVTVDWNIGPLALAIRPPASRPLFARAPLPLAPEPPAPPATVTRDRA